MRRNFESGKLVGGRLYGYRVADGRRTVHEPEAAVIRRIYKRRGEGVGMFRIARELERDGIPTPRTGSPKWWASQVGDILRNTTYKGVLSYGRTRQIHRGGTNGVEASPDEIITRDDETLRIVTDKAWNAAQAVNKSAAAATWRNGKGQLKSRPTASKWLLSPFLACGICGGSMHVRKKGRGTAAHVYFCTTYHLRGPKACTNARGLKVEHADRFVLNAFQEVLASAIVFDLLQESLEARRAGGVDPGPLKAELKRLEGETKKLTDTIARGGDFDSVKGALAERDAKIRQIKATLAGADTLAGFELRGDFHERLQPILADWRAHLKRNPGTAAQALRKLLPMRLKATPEPEGAWSITGTADYSNVLKEAGYGQALEALRAVGIIPDDTTDGVSKVKPSRCPSPCSARPSATCTTRPRRTPRR
jgi:hypothetical protein